MAEQRRTHPVSSFIKLSLIVAAGAAAGGLGGCSSNSEAKGATNSPDTSADGAIGCVGDPRGEAFTPNLTHKGTAGALSFVIVRNYYAATDDAAPQDGPPAVDNNTWTLKVLDAAGQPVKDAMLTFPKQSHPSDPWMPDHPHGAVPAKAVNNNDGTYTIAPLYFFMGGIWSTYISAQSGSVTDSTTFTFCVGS